MRTVVPSSQASRDLGFGVPGPYSKLWGWGREDRCLGSSLGFLLLPLLSTRLSACYLRFIDFLSHGYFSVFLGKIKDAFDRNPGLQNLLLDDFFKSAVENCQDSWRRAISTGVQAGIPMPCFTTALSFYDGYRHEMLPANLIQAQRDYFGAHTYELLAKPGQFIHTNWTGHGGSVSSSSYNA